MYKFLTSKVFQANKKMTRISRHNCQVLIGWIFAHMSHILPIKRIMETPKLIVFEHPQPSYSFHILIVPKKILTGLQQLCENDAELSIEILQVAEKIVRKFNLESYGYRLILNGGEYQEVPQVHFHLISENYPNPSYPSPG